MQIENLRRTDHRETTGSAEESETAFVQFSMALAMLEVASARVFVERPADRNWSKPLVPGFVTDSVAVRLTVTGIPYVPGYRIR